MFTDDVGIKVKIKFDGHATGVVKTTDPSRTLVCSETDLGSRQRFGRRGGASGRLRPLGNPKRSASLAQTAWPPGTLERH